MKLQLLSDLHLEVHPRLQVAPVPGADLLVLAVKPQVADAVMQEIGPLCRPEQVLISIVTGLSLQRLAELLVEINGSGDYVVREFPGDRKKIDIGDYYADDRLITKKLGWKPRTDLRRALERTVEFYREEIEHYI